MRIAISSDNHLDVNRVAPAAALDFQARWLRDHQVAVYLHAGDLFNDFTRTRAYFAKLADRLAGQVTVRYLAGNHDMLGGVSEAALETRLAPEYFHNAFLDLPGTAWRLVGLNGWYDYSLSPAAGDPAAVAAWKRVYWLDDQIPQAEDDPARLQRGLAQLRAQLAAATAVDKRVIVATHFLPDRALVPPMPSTNDPRRQRFWRMFCAMLGSQQVGDLLRVTPAVERVVYGHLHGQHPVRRLGGAHYYNPAVGVKRRHEWQAATFNQQWEQRLLVWDL